MYRCMPYYCALTNGHGQGAEFVMDAEAAYTQGRFERAVLLHLLESIEACYYALMGCPEQVPEVFREHKLASVAYYAPCRSMM